MHLQGLLKHGNNLTYMHTGRNKTKQKKLNVIKPYMYNVLLFEFHQATGETCSETLSLIQLGYLLIW
jgi:hypothetical protein